MREIDARIAFCINATMDVGESLYIWGGDAAEEGGFDCSGFVSRRLMWGDKVWPGFYTGGRTTADGLFRHFDGRGCPDIRVVEDLLPGCVVFYQRSPGTKMYHVALHLCTVDDFENASGVRAPIGPVSTESGGSGSAAKTPRDALLRSAGVRFTATDYHGRGVWCAKDPFSLLSF